MQYHMIMSKADKLLSKMKSNPRDWTPEQLRMVARHTGLKVRQRGTSHAVFTNDRGAHVTVPMHKPVKPVYVKQLLDLIEG
jgi:predicted RNA binding protein YcfA (HicA-like mRNA interferase family)